MLTPGLFSHDLATTFADARKDLEGTVVRDVNGKMRAGVFHNRTGALLTRNANMTLGVGDFRAVQDRGGAVFIANDGNATTPAFAAAPSANKRIDLLYMTQEIPELGDSGEDPVFGIVQGTASATPTVPALPANRADAIKIATVEIPAGATSMQSAGVIITEVFPYTAMAGGTVYVRNSVELAAWTPADGARVFNLSDNREYVRKSGSWQSPEAEPTTGVATPGAGWATASVNNLFERGGRVTLKFNAARTAALAAGGVICTIPEQFRQVNGSGGNVWDFAWGLTGAPGTCWIYYDVPANQIKTNSALSSGHSIAFTMVWER